MKIKLDLDKNLVVFLKDSAESHITSLKEDIEIIDKHGVKDDPDNKTLLELYKINITAWDSIFEVTKEALGKVK